MAVETDADLREVVQALQAWFESQDVSPIDANAAMGELIAAAIAWNVKDRGQRQVIVDSFVKCLRNAVERKALKFQ